MNKNKVPSLISELPLFLEKAEFDQSEEGKISKFTNKREENSKGLFQSIISVALTFISATIIGLSTMFFITSVNTKHIEISILVSSIIIYFIPGFYFKKENNHLLGNTLICIASMTASFSIFENLYIFLIWFSICIIGLIYSNSRFLSCFLAGILNVMTAFFLLRYSSAITGLITAQLLTTINLVLLVIIHKTASRFSLIKQYYLINQISIISLISFFCFLFTLSFIKTSSPYEYFAYNTIYFLASTGFLVWSYKHDVSVYRGLAILSWFSFIFYKYYDLLWKLLHKSISLLIFGLIFLCIGIILNRRAEQL